MIPTPHGFVRQVKPAAPVPAAAMSIAASTSSSPLIDPSKLAMSLATSTQSLQGSIAGDAGDLFAAPPISPEVFNADGRGITLPFAAPVAPNAFGEQQQQGPSVPPMAYPSSGNTKNSRSTAAPIPGNISKSSASAPKRDFAYVPGSAARSSNEKRMNYGRPPCAILSFGFGGRVMTMVPKNHHRSSMNPFHLSAEDIARPTSLGPLVQYRLIDLISAYCARPQPLQSEGVGGNNSNLKFHQSELSEFARLIKLIGQPLSTMKTDEAEAKIKSIINRRLQGPLSSSSSSSSSSSVFPAVPGAAGSGPLLSSIGDHYFASLLSSGNNPKLASGSLSKSTADHKASLVESERVLWGLLKILTENRAMLLSVHGRDDQGLEKKIAQLLQGTEDPSQPQSAVDADIHAASTTRLLETLHGSFATASTASSTQAERHIAVEKLLLVGDRDAALQLAITHGDWALAMLLSCVCGSDRYQEVVKAYAAASFPSATPLHTLSLVYSNQALSSPLCDAKALPKATGSAHTSSKFFAYSNATAAGSSAPTDASTSSSSNASSSSSSSNSDSSAVDVLTVWRHTLSAIISNKGSDWKHLSRCIGYRLLTESKNVMASHVAYLCSDALPSYPASNLAPSSSSSSFSSSSTTALDPNAGSGSSISGSSHDGGAGRDKAKFAGNYSLLGCDATLPRHKAVDDCVSISALRMTEILEWVMMQLVDSSAGASGGAGVNGATPAGLGLGSSIKSSFSGMLGWSSSTEKDTKNQSSAASAALPVAVTTATVEKVLRMRAALCPLKIRFAKVLAEHGLIAEATHYVLDAKALINLVNSWSDKEAVPSGKGMMPPSSSSSKAHHGSGSTMVRPFNKHFVRALDEFADRLGVPADRLNSAAADSWASAATLAAAAAADPHKKSSSSGSSSSNSNIWGISSVLSAISSSANLKELVDGVSPPPPPATAIAVGEGDRREAKGGSLHRGSGEASSIPPSPSMSRYGDSSHSNYNSNSNGNSSSSSGGNQSVPFQGFAPTSYGPSSGVPSSPSFSSSGSSQFDQQSAGGYGISAPYPQQQQQQQVSSSSASTFSSSSGPWGGGGGSQVPHPNGNGIASSSSGGFFDVDLAGSSGVSADQGAGSRGGAPLPPCAGFASQGNKSGAPPSLQFPQGSGPDPAFAASSSSAKSFQSPPPHKNKPQPSFSDPGKDLQAAGGAAAAKANGGESPAIVKNLRKGLLGWLYPDAHDTSENMGQGLEAYFDKATGKWVFPGESGDSGQVDPASLPPPTMGMGAPMSMSMSSSGGVPGPGVGGGLSAASRGAPGPGPNGGPPGSGEGAGTAAAYDPLAAMMAPPSYRMPSAAAGPVRNAPAMSNNDDPLAAMMAPPVPRYSMATAASSAPGGSSQPPPNINMWKPPPVSAANSGNNQ